MAFRAAIEATRAYWTEGTRFCLSVWPAPEVPAAERWARVYLWVRANAVSVEIDLEHVPHWDPLDYLPPIIAAGRLPLELRRKNGRIVLSHLESGEELAASPGTATGLRRWSCPLLGETVEGAVERVEGILAAVRRGELAEDWGFLVPETSEADDQARLALWEGLVSHQPNVASYTVSFVLGIGAAEAMESLRSFPGGWTTRYWFGSVNLRDEQGNPVGFEEDDGVALFINVGVETSPAGHRLVLESNNSFNRDPITRVTGLTFTEWEV